MVGGPLRGTYRYKHTGGRDSRGCNPHEELQRDARDLTDLAIHYGLFDAWCRQELRGLRELLLPAVGWHKFVYRFLLWYPGSLRTLPHSYRLEVNTGSANDGDLLVCLRGRVPEAPGAGLGAASGKLFKAFGRLRCAGRQKLGPFACIP